MIKTNIHIDDLKILNKDQSIYAAPKELIHPDLHGHTLIFYWPKLDVIVLNEDSPIFYDLAIIVEEYLSLNDYARKACMEYLQDDKVGEFILELNRALNRIIRIRRRIYRNMGCRRKAEEKARAVG